jgi:hypothetical protein
VNGKIASFLDAVPWLWDAAIDGLRHHNVAPKSA